jgi:outer membrane protein insertion porin family
MSARLVRMLAVGVLALTASTGFGQEAFEPWVVREFRVEGAQKLLPGTIYNYLPINIGDTIDAQRVAESIRALFAQEFFEDVELRRDGDTLVIAVRERPTIAEFTFDGNKDFKDEDLEGMLQETDLSAGKMFDRSMLEELTRFLTEEYYARGKYGAKIEPEVQELPGNQVRVHVEIEEGDRAKIREINIIGNSVFTDEELRDNFELQTGGLFSKFRKNDRYSKEALEGDLETLRSYYMNRGYADFQIFPLPQVTISPDKTDIFITINVDEGDLYTVSSIDLAGELVVAEEILRSYVFVQPGQVFSQQFVTFTEDSIARRLGSEGFARADVQTQFVLDEETKEVALTVYIEPNNRVYVRRVIFNGAENSSDEVFRREVRQLEGALLSNDLLEVSQQRLQRLPYIESVEYETIDVLGSDDLVDVEFEIEEGLPGSFGGNIGYSESQGVVLGGNFVHSNFLGTGSRLAVDLNGGKYYKVYQFNFTQPYRTMNGLSRTITFQYQDITRLSSVTSDFSTKSLSTGMTWGFPVSENQQFRLGFVYQNSELLMSAFSSRQSIDWVLDNGDSFFVGNGYFGTEIKSIGLIASWIFENRNRTIFPDLGMRLSTGVQATIPGSNVEYYTANFNVEKYFRLPGVMRIRINSELYYGDSFGETTALPPFKNFFGGGQQSVRGFKENYLGPRDSNANPNGGNLLVANQFELLLPTPAKFQSSARIALFVDVGNVFYTGDIEFYDLLGDPIDTSFDFDKLKTSYGVGVQWLSPMGLLEFSYAIPLNADEATDRYFKDQTEGFQFGIRNAF